MTEIFDRRGAEIDKVGPRRNAVEQQRKHVIAGGEPHVSLIGGDQRC